MEERKVEKELNLCMVKGEGLRKALDMVYAHASNVVEKRMMKLQSKEVELKEKSFALEERAKKVEEAEAQVVDLERKSDGFRMEVEAKRKELNFIMNQVNAEEVRLSELRISVEECEAEQIVMVESLRKTQLEIDDKGEKLAKMETDLERCRDEVSVEMESLRRTRTHMREFDEEVETKRKELNFLRNQVEISLCEANAEEVRLSELRTSVEECAAEKVLKVSELSEMVESCRQTQLELDSMKTELERYHAQVSAEMESLRKLDEEAERKLKDLTLVQDKIVECEKMFETRSSELVFKEKDLEVLCKKIDLREQTVMSLNNDMKEACQQIETKGKELENIQRLIEESSAHFESLKLLIDEHNEQLASAITPVNNVLSLDVKLEAPISNNVALSHLSSEDALLRDIESSTSLLPNEVSTELPMFKDPCRFVLTSVEKALTDASERGELSLEEPILMPLVPLLEELSRVGISTDTDLQSDATKVAHRWVKMMGASVEKSQLEAWAVLQFIVAFGLVKQTKKDQALLLASYVAHFKDAPKLFESLGLSDAIPNFVTQLCDKGLYIQAIRFMLSFNVKNNLSPLEFLKEQIINLTRSAKENRRYESQVEALLLSISSCQTVFLKFVTEMLRQ